MGNLIKTGATKQKQLDRDVLMIKEVCAKFFDMYDQKIDKVQISNHKMELQYENWSKVLIEPQALNVASLLTM